MNYLNLRTFFNPENWLADKKQLFPCLELSLAISQLATAFLGDQLMASQLASYHSLVEYSFHDKFQLPKQSRSDSNILARVGEEEQLIMNAVIIMQVSVQIGLNWNCPTRTELGKNCTTGSYVAACVPVLCLHIYQGCSKKQKVGFKISTLDFPSTWHVWSHHKIFQPSRQTRTPSTGSPLFSIGDVKGKYLQIYNVVISQPPVQKLRKLKALYFL